MRLSQTVARALLIASIAHSTLAVPSSALAEDTHNVKRLPPDFAENAKNVLKTTGIIGSIAGLFSAIGSSVQRLIIQPHAASNSTRYALLLCPPANASPTRIMTNI